MGIHAGNLGQAFDRKATPVWHARSGSHRTVGETATVEQSFPPIEFDEKARQACVASLYRDYAGPMRGFLAQYSKNDDDIADIIQDVFTRIVRIRNLTGIMENPKAYLMRAAMNMLRDRYRYNCCRQMRQHEPIDNHSIVANQPSLESQVTWQQTMVILVDALRSDGPGVYKVVVMSCLDGMTHSEIAHRLNVTVRTVERYMQRARKVCMQKAEYLPLALPELAAELRTE